MKEITYNPPDRIKRLIDAASRNTGGQNALARAIGYSNAEVSQWRHHVKHCPIEAQALLASLAGYDATEVLAYAVIEKHAHTERGARLTAALGKSFRAMSEALWASTAAVAVWAFDPQTMARLIDAMYRKAKSA